MVPGSRLQPLAATESRWLVACISAKFVLLNICPGSREDNSSSNDKNMSMEHMSVGYMLETKGDLGSLDSSPSCFQESGILAWCSLDTPATSIEVKLNKACAVVRGTYQHFVWSAPDRFCYIHVHVSVPQISDSRIG